MKLIKVILSCVCICLSSLLFGGNPNKESESKPSSENGGPRKVLGDLRINYGQRGTWVFRCLKNQNKTCLYLMQFSENGGGGQDLYALTGDDILETQLPGNWTAQNLPFPYYFGFDGSTYYPATNIQFITDSQGRVFTVYTNIPDEVIQYQLNN